MLYAAGSLLFAFATICALTVIFMSFARYRIQMIAALRTLSLDGIHEPSPVPSPSGLTIKARPAPRLAA